MQTRKQILNSDNRSRYYSLLSRAGKSMTMCRGLTKDDSTFFYSDEPLWAPACHVWVDAASAVPVCNSCLILVHQQFKNIA